ncbi:HD domain-containing protein [Paenibacillus sp. HJL G12]|uniref:HD domain-containing protein n=1 Tax=Paenibacillus dendrobii TaxID=2691084 RepID=A0A7X3IQQ4_9BACL|nr:HD domain-containing protein [Paenibacillus dendrobii]MWV47160.1 HD domain-containing protein [Paenibacillus dendrobii]
MKGFMDTLYGTDEMEQVIIDIINSNVFQRLKYVHQGGAGFLVNERWNVTRYDHSIGTMILAKRLGGNIQEQIASLLHDVSHTAFSHVIDYILKNRDENYHDTNWRKVIDNSEIPLILRQHEIKIEEIYDVNYFALEADLPSLSIDRIDYTLRDMFHQEEITREDINNFLSSLSTDNEQICLNSTKVAEWFFKLYYKEVIGYFKNPLNLYVNETMTEILQTSLEKDIITIEDFQLTDDQLLNIVRNSEDDNIISKLDELISMKNSTTQTKLPNDYSIKVKTRIIDPIVLIENKSYKLTEISEEAKKINNQITQTN